MRLLIIRHADPDYPNNTITAAGHLEAKALAKKLKHAGLTRLYASPLGRAIHTMQYTADATGLPHTIEEWTREMSIALETTPEDWGHGGKRLMAWDIPGEIVRNCTDLPTCADWHTRNPFSDATFRAAFDDLQKNSDAFLARHGYFREGHRYRIVQPNREKIAVFCHGGFGLTWLAHLLGLPVTMVWAGFWLPPSSVTTVLFDERSPQWATPRILGMGDVGHLYEAGLPIQPAGIKANYD